MKVIIQLLAPKERETIKRVSPLSASVWMTLVSIFCKNSILHLKHALEKCFTCQIDWMESHYLRLTLEWNYKKKYENILNMLLNDLV